MTEAEIIKLLSWYLTVAKRCGSVTLDKEVMVGLCDLINRQKAEAELKTMDVESLTSERDALQEMVAEQKAEIESLKADYIRACAERDARIVTQRFTKSEAYREFAMRALRRIGFIEYPNAVVRGHINKTYEELTEVSI